MKIQIRKPLVQRKKVKHGVKALRYPIFRCLCPELSDEEFLAMRATVCGSLFKPGVVVYA